MRRILVDTGAWIALSDRADSNHGRAAQLWRSLRQLPVRLFTSDYILDEAYTFLRQRLSLEAAIALHDLLEGSQAVQVFDVDAQTRQEAWQLFAQQREENLSFTDFTSLALATKLELSQAFTFDPDLAQLGFEIIP